MKKMTKISTAVASLLLVGLANAATPGAYVGAGLGESVLRTPNYSTITDDFSGYTTSQKRNGLAGRVFAGYNFNSNFGLEAALASYAQTNWKVSSPIATGTVKDSLTALSVVAKGYLPIGDTGLNAYALGGLAEVHNVEKAKITAFGVNASDSERTSSLRPTYGIGMSYDMPNHVTTSLEISRIQGKGNMNTDAHAIPNADLVTLNVGYNFG